MTVMNADKHTNKNKNGMIKFLLPSLIGILLFLVPIPYGEGVNIGIGIISDGLKVLFGAYLEEMMVAVLLISAIGTVITYVAKPKAITESETLSGLFNEGTLWLMFRVLGAIFAVMVYANVGPEFLIGGDTGHVMLDLLVGLSTWFALAMLLIPFLMNFGLMDFIGTMIKGIMRPLFKVPGRSAVDALASWIGCGSTGIMLTSEQYKQGFYTARESVIIASCFSISSLPFSIVIAETLGLSHMFFAFYGSICIATFVAGIIIPRLGPVSKIKDEYFEGAEKDIAEETPEGVSTFSWAVTQATKRASNAAPLKSQLKDGVHGALDIYIGFFPIIMAWGTIGLIIAEFTPIFTIISYPLILILEMFNVPAAAEAAPALLIGFTDMFLPAILVADVQYEMTKFIVGVVSFSQLIYLSEVGSIILKSHIPLKFKDLVIIFLQRTAIVLPVAIILANIIF